MWNLNQYLTFIPTDIFEINISFRLFKNVRSEQRQINHTPSTKYLKKKTRLSKSNGERYRNTRDDLNIYENERLIKLVVSVNLVNIRSLVQEAVKDLALESRKYKDMQTDYKLTKYSFDKCVWPTKFSNGKQIFCIDGLHRQNSERTSKVSSNLKYCIILLIFYLQEMKPVFDIWTINTENLNV